MADVRFTITVQNIYTKTDAVTLTAVDDVDIVPVLEERSRDLTLCNDTSSIAAPKQIQRVIVCSLSSEFEAKFPTTSDQRASLRNSMKRRFEKQLPAVGVVTETIEIGAYCP